MPGIFHATASCRICPLGDQLQLTISGLTGCCFVTLGTVKFSNSDLNGTFILDITSPVKGPLCDFRLYQRIESLPVYDCDTDELVGNSNLLLQVEWKQSKGTRGRVMSVTLGFTHIFRALDYSVGWDAGATIPSEIEACGSPSVGPWGYGGTAVVELVPP